MSTTLTRQVEIKELIRTLSKKIDSPWGEPPDYACGQRLTYRLYKLIVAERKEEKA